MTAGEKKQGCQVNLNIHSYLLVISVWERQDGENTALKDTQRESIC